MTYHGWSIPGEIALRWMSLVLFDGKSTLVQVRLGTVRQIIIIWANVDPDLCRYMAPLGINELILNTFVNTPCVDKDVKCVDWKSVNLIFTYVYPLGSVLTISQNWFRAKPLSKSMLNQFTDAYISIARSQWANAKPSPETTLVIRSGLFIQKIKGLVIYMFASVYLFIFWKTWIESNSFTKLSVWKSDGLYY